MKNFASNPLNQLKNPRNASNPVPLGLSKWLLCLASWKAGETAVAEVIFSETRRLRRLKLHESCFEIQRLAVKATWYVKCSLSQVLLSSIPATRSWLRCKAFFPRIELKRQSLSLSPRALWQPATTGWTDFLWMIRPTARNWRLLRADNRFWSNCAVRKRSRARVATGNEAATW